MTIKKRLIISNVLMIVVPVLVSIVFMGLCFVVFNAIYGGALVEWIQMEKEEDMHEEPNAIEMNDKLFTALLLIGLAAALILTNQFLIKFVFKKIEKPLNVLSSGVHQISAGNLDYRINYSGNDEFRQICDDFNGMAEHLKASIEKVQKNERNRKELLSSISHDLRSPLTSVKGFVEGLRDGVAATPEAQREYLTIIQQKTDDIISMVSQLFMYSKMDMGNYPASPERLDIGQELADFIAASQEEYRAKGLNIELADIPVDGTVFADPVQLRSVFTNILSNSAKYKNKAMATAAVCCVPQDGIFRILFEDDGPGVPEDTLTKLFDAFYRGDPSRSNPHQGSGLGLAISQKALERMGGRIYAQNLASGGLRVVVDIPALREDKA